jgi:hypothetical protein
MGRIGGLSSRRRIFEIVNTDNKPACEPAVVRRLRRGRPP